MGFKECHLAPHQSTQLTLPLSLEAGTSCVPPSVLSRSFTWLPSSDNFWIVLIRGGPAMPAAELWW